ncbi:hypothetical protein ZEAMMB73_Zm00001d045253 [Zea mays]|uniref:Helitron helicase-like domain-containing protein n=1 Tax=Zea mays TaxID=4577 RepID=A0A1D6NUT7_MAIZE|nr:hypothetical protein ZEAMMB73_Zm00001d045253 [Zea mays]
MVDPNTGGKVNLKPFERLPPLLVDLLRFDGGASIDKTINNGTAPYVFKINGVVHHRIGTLLPQHGTQPKFAQLYTYDTEHETQNRLGMFETDDGAGGHPDPEIASSLLDMLNENNSLVKAFRYARERLEREGDQKITLRLLGRNTRHDVQYNLPSNGEIAAIIVGDYTTGEHTYFGADDVGSSKRKYVMMLEFVRRHLHYRLDEPNPYTCYGRLSDQIDVDAYSTIEGNRLQFIASHQSELRSETVQGIADAIDKGFLNADSIGGRVVVPASFTGGRSNNSSVNVVLWGGQASLFPGEQIYNDGQSSPQILMFVGTLVKKYADGLCLSGGSPCKWYINPDVPEACALMASARKVHSPIKWNKVLSSNQPMPHVPEEQKIACIRDLHPFENKDREFLVIVTVKKIGDRWWYNACKKCTRTTVAHGDSYKCSDQVCATIGTPNQRTRSSPAKTVTKRLFTDIDGGTTGFKDAADNTAAPSPSKDA